ncbi:MAG: alpha/beta hydrolase, partial [Salana multivorans]|nr:alpha/beta hydrolase [Salana multivorans]
GVELSTPRLDRVRERFAPGTLARSRWRLAVWTLVVVLAYAVVGVLAGPRWNPEPVSTSVQPETESVSVLGSTPGTVLGRYDTVSRLVDLQLDGATTQVLIVSPLGVPEPLADAGLPAAVFLHGAGTGLAESFAEHAQALASAGVVAVVPSKRLDTYTTTHRDYVAMAADYARSVQLARELPEVDPARVGLYAESEGTWIAPILAVDDPAIAFVALVSAPVVTPREQGAFAVDAYLREVGVPRSFLRAIPRATGAHLPGGILAYADFDVLPYLRELTQPVFMAYGTQDASMPTVQGPQIVAGALPGGVEQLMVRYYADANHGIRIGSSTDPVVPDFLAGLAAWMIDPVAAQAAGPVVAGATPRQVHMASAVPQPRWYADGEMLLRVPGISAAVVIGGFLVVLAGAVIGRAQSSRGLRAFL